MNSLIQRGLRLVTQLARDALKTSSARPSPRRVTPTTAKPRDQKRGASQPGTSRGGPERGTSQPGTTQLGSPTKNHADIGEYDTTRGLPNFQYAPASDGDADPGEVCWTWVPYEEDATRGKDRPVLVLARERSVLVIAQLTSKDHDRDARQEARFGRYWMDIGTGAWDVRSRPSEVRLDRLLWVVPDAVRREGGRLDKPIFDAVAAALIELHGH